MPNTETILTEPIECQKEIIRYEEQKIDNESELEFDRLSTNRVNEIFTLRDNPEENLKTHKPRLKIS